MGQRIDEDRLRNHLPIVALATWIEVGHRVEHVRPDQHRLDDLQPRVKSCILALRRVPQPSQQRLARMLCATKSENAIGEA
eukprot:1729836-Prymnesium_polylepis.1